MLLRRPQPQVLSLSTAPSPCLRSRAAPGGFKPCTREAAGRGPRPPAPATAPRGHTCLVVGLLDLLLRGGAGHAEHLVIVLLGAGPGAAVEGGGSGSALRTCGGKAEGPR